MIFTSLKDPNTGVSFEQALFDGIAPGGGLYMPTFIPQISVKEMKGYTKLSFPQTAYEVLNKWLSDDIDSSDLRHICERAFNFELPIVQVGEYKILELFHGPTLAFKDVAARFLAQTMQYYLAKNGNTLNLVVATSGDTGGAIASAFGGLSNINVFILFPKDRVSVMQRQQLTQVEANVIPLEIEGSFDDCQTLVKTILADKSLELPFSTANSINIGRLLPQISYYVYARAQLGEYAAIVPTGNLGNATAALLAHKMGAGPNHITLACNANDTLLKFAQNKKYISQSSAATLSNAMDVGDPNNFTRYFAALDDSHDKFDELTDVVSVGDEETVLTIKRIYEKLDYLLDPHTSVAWRAAESSAQKLPKLIVSTAAPIKFAAEIENATGITIKKSPYFENSRSRADKSQLVSNDYEQVKKIIVLHAKK